jgi:hypothetical protein
VPIGQALWICKGMIRWRKQASIFLWWVCESWVFGLARSKIHRFVMSDVHWSSRLLYIAYAFVPIFFLHVLYDPQSTIPPRYPPYRYQYIGLVVLSVLWQLARHTSSVWLPFGRIIWT